MIGRAAISASAVRRVCSMLAPASKSTPTDFSFKMDPDLNQFFKRFTSFIRPGDNVKKTIPFPGAGDPFVKYTASGGLSPSSLEAETLMPEPDNDNKLIFYLSRSFIGGYHFTPISLEDDGSLSPKRPIFVPSQFQRSGLLFARCYNFNGVFLGKKGPRMFAWNPATSEIRELPVSPHKVNRMLGKVLRKGSVFVATWTDPKSEDYKVMNVFSYNDDDDDIWENSYPIEFELYSLKTDSWKKLRWEGEGKFESWQYMGRNCYINGVIYMNISSPDTRECILCFDFPSETFSILPLPVEIHYAYQLVKYNGKLSVFSAQNLGKYEKDMVHWVRKNGEWVKVGVYYLYGDLRKPLGFARNDELLLFQRWCPLDHLDSLMVFDFTTGELQLVPDCVSRGDFLLLDFHDTSFLKLKPPSVSGAEISSSLSNFQSSTLRDEMRIE